MPIKRSSYKNLRKSRVKHLRNVATKHELKTLIKNLEKLLSEKKAEEAKKAMPGVISKINRAATKGIIKKNTASRKIARLMARLSRTSAKT